MFMDKKYLAVFLAFVSCATILSASTAARAGDLTVVSTNRGLTVRGDASVYYQVKPGRELEIKITGPTKLKVTVRASAMKGEKNPQDLELAVSIDAKVVKTLHIKRDVGSKVIYTETGKYIPSLPVEELINIPEGTHRVTFQTVDKNKGGAAVAVAQEAAEEEALPLIPLVPVTEGEGGEPPSALGEKKKEEGVEEAPAWATKPTIEEDKTTLTDEEKKKSDEGVAGKTTMERLSFWGLVTAGVGAAALVGGTVFWLKAKSKADENNTLVSDTKSELSDIYAEEYEKRKKESQALRSEAESAASTATIFYAAGGVFVVTGVVLMVVDDFSVFQSTRGYIEAEPQDTGEEGGGAGGDGGGFKILGMRASAGAAPLPGGISAAIKLEF
ncbi:MAG: hypothetical protein Kow0090_05720 [Myxococcota bacterium]